MDRATTIEELLEVVAKGMRDALRDPDLLAPDQVGVIYEDPDGLFNVSSAMSEPGQQSTPHGSGGGSATAVGGRGNFVPGGSGRAPAAAERPVGPQTRRARPPETSSFAAPSSTSFCAVDPAGTNRLLKNRSW